MASITPTQNDVYIAVKAFLAAVMPTDVEVVTGGQNRVPSPQVPRFAVMNILRIGRLRTNVDDDADVRFTGSIAGTTLTVTDVDFGEIVVGATVFGVDILTNTRIDALGSGTGGVGTYTVSQAQTLSSRVLASGAKQIEQGTELVMQIDFYSNDPSSADLAVIASTILRDESGVDLFAGTGVTPLYADDPKSVPFIDEEQQSEWRWLLECHFQVNQITAMPQQYMDTVTVAPVSVDAVYPP